MNVRRVEFAAYENAIPQGPEAAEELKKIFEMLKGL
jgi:hypothetical protein